MNATEKEWGAEQEAWFEKEMRWLESEQEAWEKKMKRRETETLAEQGDYIEMKRRKAEIAEQED